MKRLLGSILLICLSSAQVFAAGVDIVTLDKTNLERPEITKTSSNQTIKGSLLVNDSETLANIIDEQKKHDLKDLERLWQGTVENNQVIEFALKKLATPESQRRIHSSLMAKSMSAIISGAALLPSFLGMNYGIQSGAYAAGRLANNLINKENTEKLKNPSLTDTEAIELASLIEDLQDEIIVDYYRYKGALIKLKKCEEQLLLHNKNYSDALQNKNSLNYCKTLPKCVIMHIQ